MSEYGKQVREKVYDREVRTHTGLTLSTPYVHIEHAVDEDSGIRVDDIHDGKVNLATFGDAGDCEFSIGTRLTPDQARELASALYEAANVSETWEDL